MKNIRITSKDHFILSKFIMIYILSDMSHEPCFMQFISDKFAIHHEETSITDTRCLDIGTAMLAHARTSK